MHDPDPKCRHFGILWHFGIFAKKSDRKSDPIFPILSDFFLIFRLFPTFRFHSSSFDQFSDPKKRSKIPQADDVVNDCDA